MASPIVDFESYRRDMERKIAGASLDGGGGSGHDGGMEARLAKLEGLTEGTGKRIDRVEADLRLLLAATIGGFLLLAGLLAKGFHWIG